MAQTFPLETISKLLDLTPRRVNQLAAEGVIPKADRGRYELVPVVRAYVRYLRDKAVKGDVHGDDYSTQRVRLMKARADVLEMEKAQMENNLIPAQDVQDAWIEVLSACRAKLLSLPTKTAPEVFAASDLNDVKTILKETVNEALAELANVKVEVNHPIRSSELEENNLGSDEDTNSTTESGGERVGRRKQKAVS
jgi:phage terminase Nu1 subunit (DNA packaging protein)